MKYNIEQDIILFTIKMIIMYNAIKLGWDIKILNYDKIVISKKITKLTELDNNTEEFLNTIIQSH